MLVTRNKKGGNSTATQAERSIVANAIADVNAIIATHGVKYRNDKLARDMISLESLDDITYQDTIGTFNQLKADLRASSLVNLLSGLSNEEMDASLESAAYTIIGGSSPESYYALGNKQLSAVTDGGSIVHPVDGGTAFSMESFDPATAAKYLAATAVANAQATIAGGFEDVWFPQQLVPAGQNGVDVQITIPKIFHLTTRNSDSSPIDFKKKSIIEAILDPSLLESDATTVVPYAINATTPTQLVPAAQIPTVIRVIDGIDVPTRPIRYGQEVDIIKLSNAPGLISSGVFDETDSLDPIMNHGTMAYKVDVVEGANTLAFYAESDVSTQVGTLLTQVQAGAVQQYQTTATVSLNINKDFVVLNGTAKATVVSSLETILGIGAGDDFNIIATVKISAEANTETGYFLVNANNTAITKLYGPDATPISLTALSAPGVTLTITPLGYIPLVRRTNSNLRQNGTIIDSNTTVTYRFPVQLSAPIISQAPVGASNNVTLEGLNHAARIRQNGRAVRALDSMEKMLVPTSGIPAQSFVMGAEFVLPTYVRHPMDVATVVTTLASKDAIQNLRGALAAALTNLVNELIYKSHYLAALELAGSGIDDFEIIVVTDTKIAPHIWEPGDIRTFGDKRDYIVTKSNNVFFKDKIYVSFRRKSRSGEIHPLDFGTMLLTPPITYDVTINRNGRTVNEIHTVPRVNAYATLPILGRIDVSNMDTLFVDQP